MRDGEWMEGHHKRWRRMHLVAVRRGAEGGLLEEHLICVGKEDAGWSYRCANTATESQGLSKDDSVLNFVYVCTK